MPGDFGRLGYCGCGTMHGVDVTLHRHSDLLVEIITERVKVLKVSNLHMNDISVIIPGKQIAGLSLGEV